MSPLVAEKETSWLWPCCIRLQVEDRLHLHLRDRRPQIRATNGFMTGVAAFQHGSVRCCHEQHRRDSHSDDIRRELLRRAVEKADGEQQRLVDAIAQGAGDVSVLVAALRQRQEQLLGVRSELDGINAAPAAPFDRGQLAREAHARLVDWQGLLRANTKEARRVLATLLDGRLTFTPKREGRRQFYEFTVSHGDDSGNSRSDFGGDSHHKVWRPQRDSNPCFGLERATSWASGRWGR